MLVGLEDKAGMAKATRMISWRWRTELIYWQKRTRLSSNRTPSYVHTMISSTKSTSQNSKKQTKKSKCTKRFKMTSRLWFYNGTIWLKPTTFWTRSCLILHRSWMLPKTRSGVTMERSSSWASSLIFLRRNTNSTRRERRSWSSDKAMSLSNFSTTRGSWLLMKKTLKPNLMLLNPKTTRCSNKTEFSRETSNVFREIWNQSCLSTKSTKFRLLN